VANHRRNESWSLALPRHDTGVDNFLFFLSTPACEDLGWPANSEKGTLSA